MKIYNFTILLFSILLFRSCDLGSSINFEGMQGYYQYHIIDFNTGMVKDTLFSCSKVTQLGDDDTLKIYNSILGLYLGKDNRLFYLWTVDEVNGKLVPKTYTFLNKLLPVNSTWRVEEEIGFESGTFERKFKILSKDTCLVVFSKRLDNILLLEQRDWIDVGGKWGVQLFGFNKSDKLVYLHEYVESEPWSDLTKKTHSRLYPNRTLIHTENFTYQEIKDYLILDKFIMSNSISDIECENWENRNTQFTKKWLSWRDDLEDFIPPPRPYIEDSESDSLIDDYIIEIN